MRIQKQITTCLGNKPGALARMLGALKKRKVNGLGISVVDSTDQCIVRLMVDDVQKAVKALNAAGYCASTQSVVAGKIQNRRGAVQSVAAALAKKGINIHYLYCTASADQKTGFLVVSTNDLKKTVKALK